MDNSCLKKSKYIKLIIHIPKTFQKKINKDWKHTYVSFLSNLKYHYIALQRFKDYLINS